MLWMKRIAYPVGDMTFDRPFCSFEFSRKSLQMCRLLRSPPPRTRKSRATLWSACGCASQLCLSLALIGRTYHTRYDLTSPVLVVCLCVCACLCVRVRAWMRMRAFVFVSLYLLEYFLGLVQGATGGCVQRRAFVPQGPRGSKRTDLLP